VLAAASAAQTPQELGSTAALRLRRGRGFRFQRPRPHEASSFHRPRSCARLLSRTHTSVRTSVHPECEISAVGLAPRWTGSLPGLRIGSCLVRHRYPSTGLRACRSGSPLSGGAPQGHTTFGWHSRRVVIRAGRVRRRNAPRTTPNYPGQGIRRLTTAV